MKSQILLTTFLLCGIVGCREATEDRTLPSTAVESAESQIDAQISVSDLDSQTEIVNSFGMKFVRIAIDRNAQVSSDPPYPAETYYIQQAEISDLPYDKLRPFAKPQNLGPKGHVNIPMAEWRDFSDLAELMSRADPDYDYRLPTKSEWVFACMGGYKQNCEANKQNAYGLIDMLDGDVECVSEVGVLMGLWKEKWSGIYDGHKMHTCPCKRWTICNPDADDDLNEIIVGRFVLVPKKATRP